jgi:hypothetical protein
MSERQIPCPYCVNGIAGEVSREMAIDAGCPEMEGQPMRCAVCKGEGFLIEETAHD